MAAPNGSEFFDIDVEQGLSDPFGRPSNAEAVQEDEDELLWAAIERLPSHKRLNYAIVRRNSARNPVEPETIDVTKLDRQGRERLVRKALATNEQDNYNLLSGIKQRFDRCLNSFPSLTSSLWH